ncbi:MAG: transpeptidase family protein [Chitinophagaceae bacterium]|nr:transpeptidase family protein [Chitinophagaceae bacterium]
MTVKKDILWRVYLSFLGIVVLGVVILVKALYIQYAEGGYWRSLSDSIFTKYVTLQAQRGSIFSEDGQLLSASIPTFDIYMDFQADGLTEGRGKRFFENVDSLAFSLSAFFRDKTQKEYKKELLQAYRKKLRYYPLKKKLTYEEYKIIREFPLARLGKNKGGFIVEVKTKRLMPYGMLAGRTIGLSREHIASDGKIKKQNVGIEKSYDSLLSGKDGMQLVRFVAGQAAIPVDGTQTEPEHGKDIYITLDVNIQDITQTALMRALTACQGPYGLAIVMETKTGKIKALCNLGRQPDGSYYEDDNYALRTTEPGSTLKLVTLLSVLEKGKIRPDEEIEIGTAGKATVANKIITDAEKPPKPRLTIDECFAHSSNIGMSKLAWKTFGDRPAEFREYFKRFKLDVRSPIDLSDVPSPYIAPLNQKGSQVGNLLWMSFGYGIRISPLHTLTLYNAVANGGRMMKPYLVSRVESEGVIIRQFEPEVLKEAICKPQIIQKARKALEKVVKEGTARKVFQDLPFPVAGKTGTAHVSDGPIKYSHGVYQASFVGYFPANDPQFTCMVLIRTRPHDPNHFGSTLAAPVFKEIAQRLYPLYVRKAKHQSPVFRPDSVKESISCVGAYHDFKTFLNELNITYNDSASVQSGWNHLNISAKKETILKTAYGVETQNNIMPDLKGLGLKDAIYLLEKSGLKAEIRGKGKVISQSVSPGSRIKEGITVMLVLE